MTNYLTLSKEMRSLFFDDSDYSLFNDITDVIDEEVLSVSSNLFEEIVNFKHTKQSLHISQDLTDTFLFYFVEQERHFLPHFVENLARVVNEHSSVRLVEKWWSFLDDTEKVELLSSLYPSLFRSVIEPTVFHRYIDAVHPHQIVRCLSNRGGTLIDTLLEERMIRDKLYEKVGSWDLFLNVPFFTRDNAQVWLPYARQCGNPLPVEQWRDLIKKTEPSDYFAIIQDSLTASVMKHCRFELKGLFNILDVLEIKYLLKFKIPSIDESFILPEEWCQKWTLQEGLGVPLSLNDDPHAVSVKQESNLYL